jgi:Holliday junction resolvase RusA-like endonuclease
VIAFRVSCIPPKTSHHSKRIVRIGTGPKSFSKLADNPDLLQAKATLEAILLPHRPAAPLAGPISMRLEFTWPWLSSHSKRIRSQGRIPMTSRPDLTNLAKTLEDRLVALRFLEDDNAVVRLTLVKWWGDDPGILVRIQPFEIRPTFYREGLGPTVLEALDRHFQKP